MPQKGVQDSIREKAIELHSQGLSRGEIGARLGKTRNSIIGLLYRAGIRDEPVSRVVRARKQARVQSARIRDAAVQSRLRKAKQRSEIVNEIFKIDDDYSIKRNEKWDAENPSPNPQTILAKDRTGRLHANEQLTETCCRFGIGDPAHRETFHFCGREKVPGLSYCRDHSLRCFQNAPPKGGKVPTETETPKILEPTN